MKVEWRLFAGAALFCGVFSAVYWFVSYEQAGTAMLLIAAVAVGFVGSWLFVQSRRVGARPEDRPDAHPGEGAGEIGYFPAASLWPLVCAAGAVMAANALVFGAWLAVTGAVILTIGVVGYAAEASAKA